MRKSWRFTISGTGSGATTFHTSGTVHGECSDTLDLAMKETFDQLTHGRAIYGSPGVGCAGPYDITSITIEQIKQ